VKCEFVQVANAFFKGAQSAEYFAFAMNSCTFNQVCALRKVVQVNSALHLAANRQTAQKLTFIS